LKGGILTWLRGPIQHWFHSILLACRLLHGLLAAASSWLEGRKLTRWPWQDASEVVVSEMWKKKKFLPGQVDDGQNGRKVAS
jgi:hypothetical protein